MLNFIKLLIILCLMLTLAATALLAQTPTETPPLPGKAPSLTVPQIREMTLPNGLKVVVVPRRDIPLVTVSLLVKTGASYEDDKKAGVANMTAELLTKGTEFRTATDIASQIEFLGGSIESGANWNSSGVTVNVMSDTLGKALSIMSDVVIRPAFPAKEIALLKKQTVDGLNVSLKQPGTVLSYVASRYSFDEHTTVGTPQTVQRILRNDILEFHREQYQPDNSVLIFTGDISEKQAFGFARLFFSSWQKIEVGKEIIADIVDATNLSGLSMPDKKPPTINRMLVVDLPNSGQAAVGYTKRFYEGRIICGEENCESSEIYYPANVLNSVLGGGYSSRLNQEIRLKRGLSYGAGSGFDWRGFDTNFSARTQTKNESAAEVADLIKIEIEKLINDSVLDVELVPRKAVVTGGFGLGLQTNEGLAARLRDIYLFNLNPDELNSYLNNVNKVTDMDIKAFATANLSGGDVIIVGDSKLFMADLKKRFPNQKIETIKASDLDLNSATLRKR